MLHSTHFFQRFSRVDYAPLYRNHIQNGRHGGFDRLNVVETVTFEGDLIRGNKKKPAGAKSGL